MKSVLIRPQRVLAGANVALLVAIGAFWQFGASPWQPPAAVEPDAAALAPLSVQRVAPDMAMLQAIIERPLFVPERRPVVAKLPAEEAASAPVDIFNDIRLVGIIGKGPESVVIVNVGGKARRVRQGEQLEGWTLQETDGRMARFEHAPDQKRELVMRYAVQGGVTAASAGTAAPAPVAGTSASPQQAPQQASGAQAAEDFVAARRARREALWRSRGIK